MAQLLRRIYIAIVLSMVSAGLHGQIILDSIVVKAQKERISTNTYTPRKARMVVPITGETDVLRLIATMPGVSSGIEGTSSFFVRGGNNGNNRIELDGVPFYDCGHLLGLISSFPAGIIDNVSFRKGGQSASKGDFSASLTEIRTKEKPDGSTLSVSPFFAGAYSSGYIGSKGKISYMASARYTLVEPLWLAAKEIASINGMDFKPISGDAFFKVNVPVSKRNVVSVGGYYSTDDISYSKSRLNMAMKWNNSVAYINWKYNPSDWLQIESKGYYTLYNNGQTQKSFLDDQWSVLLSFDELIKEYAFSSQAQVNIKNFRILAGFEWKHREFDWGNSAGMTKGKYKTTSLFTDIEFKNRFVSATAGIRQSGNNLDLTDLHLDLCGYLGKNGGIEMTYDKMYQLSHMTEGGLAGWRDFIVPATNSLPAEVCNQVYFGGYYSRSWVKATLGVYYKKIENLTSFVSASALFSGDFSDWKDILEIGTGVSYGVESSLQLILKKFSGNVSYTMSKTDRQYDRINNGERFPFQYDRRHILNALASYNVVEKKNRSQNANINISYTSGGYSTLPIARYQAASLPYIVYFKNNGSLTDETYEHLGSLLLVPGVNGFRMPPYFRIDIGYSFNWKRARHESELTVGVCNILNRHNASLIYYQDGLWRQLCIIPIMPNISFKVGF